MGLIPEYPVKSCFFGIISWISTTRIVYFLNRYIKSDNFSLQLWHKLISGGILMDINTYKIFVSVAETNSISYTAELLGYTQSGATI